MRIRVLTVAAIFELLAGCAGEPPIPCTQCGEVCVDIKTDSANCGACGTQCGAGKLCAAGACKDNCPSGQKICGNKCSDVTSDPFNCGACGTQCGEGKACVGSSCVDSCPAGQTICGNKCVDKQVDPANCGDCGTLCTAGQLCSAGMCGASCAAPLIACNGKCVNFANDPLNCGGCGTACTPANAVAAVCASGACGYSRCASGFSDCDGNAVNGCEASTSADVNNCGGCNAVCLPQNVAIKPAVVPDGGADAGVDGGADAGAADAGVIDAGSPCGPLPDGGSLGPCFPPAGAVCAASSCGYEICQPGFADCDGVTANGCEANVKTSLAHCGGCNQSCAGPDGVCSNGACYVDRPSYHFPMGGQPFPATEPQYWRADRPRAHTLSFAAIPPATIYYTTNGAEPQVDGGNGTIAMGGSFKLLNIGDSYIRWFAVYGDGRRELYTQTYHSTVNPGTQIGFGSLAEDLNFAGGGSLRVVDAGTPLSFQVGLQAWHAQPSAPYCATCVIVPGLGLEGVGRLDCANPVFPAYPGAFAAPIINTAAPLTRGAYYIRYGAGTVFNCSMLGVFGEPAGVVIVR